MATESSPESSGNVARRAAAAFAPYKLQVIGIVLLILVTAGLGVVNPLLIRKIFDNALFPESGAPDLSLLWTLAGVMVGATVLNGALGTTSNQCHQHRHIPKHAGGDVPHVLTAHGGVRSCHSCVPDHVQDRGGETAATAKPALGPCLEAASDSLLTQCRLRRYTEHNSTRQFPRLMRQAQLRTFRWEVPI